MTAQRLIQDIVSVYLKRHKHITFLLFLEKALRLFLERLISTEITGFRSKKNVKPKNPKLSRVLTAVNRVQIWDSVSF